MKTRQAELRAIPQFDCGRWKLRLELLPFPSRKQTIDMHDSVRSKPSLETGFSYLLAGDLNKTLSVSLNSNVFRYLTKQNQRLEAATRPVIEVASDA